MPQFEVIVTTRYLCEAPDHKEASFLCRTFATRRRPGTEGVQALSATADDVYQVPPNGTSVADDLYDVSRESDDDCAICGAPAFESHEVSCPKNPTYNPATRRMETGFLAEPKKSRATLESMSGAELDALSLKGDEMAKSLQDAAFGLDASTPATESPDPVVEDGGPTAADLGRDPVDSIFVLLVDVDPADMPRVLRRVFCQMFAFSGAFETALDLVEANIRVCVIATKDYDANVIFGLDPEFRLYLNFARKEIRQMPRPHILGEGQEWF
jgi:hypothetical protein